MPRKPNPIAERLYDQIRTAFSSGERERMRLAVVEVCDGPASTLYVKFKRRARQRLGMHFQHVHLSSTDMLTTLGVCHRLNALNQDDTIHGIIVQLPLPSKLDTTQILDAVNPSKEHRPSQHPVLVLE